MDIFIKLPLHLQKTIYLEYIGLCFKPITHDIKTKSYSLKSPYDCLGLGNIYSRDDLFRYRDSGKYYENLDYIYSLLVTSKRWISPKDNTSFISYSFKYKPNGIITKCPFHLINYCEFIKNVDIYNGVTHSVNDNINLPDLNNYIWEK